MNKQAVKEMAAVDAGKGPLSSKELQRMNAYWRACNYLAVGMIYLHDNPLLTEPLKMEHVKNRFLGHWGASPALSFVWAHLNRLISKYDLDVIFLAGPAMARPECWARHIWRVPTPKSSPTRAKTPRNAEVLQAVLLPRAHRQPRHARNSGLYP